MGPDDPSTAITRAGSDTRVADLRRMGLNTTQALADLDRDDPNFF